MIVKCLGVNIQYSNIKVNQLFSIFSALFLNFVFVNDENETQMQFLLLHENQDQAQNQVQVVKIRGGGGWVLGTDQKSGRDLTCD